MRHLSAKVWDFDLVVEVVVSSVSKLPSSSRTLIWTFFTFEKSNRILPLNLALWRGAVSLTAISESRRTKRRRRGCDFLQSLSIFEQTLNDVFGTM